MVVQRPARRRREGGKTAQRQAKDGLTVTFEPFGRLAAKVHVGTLVPVAASLVASSRLHCLDGEAELRARTSTPIGKASFQKGEEMGWFQHGSTIIVFAPDGFALCDDVREGANIRMGQPLLRLS